jgi:uncharacterized Zn finger protein
MTSKGFASTWWGQAWVEALEEASSLDPSRLSRGRTYARQGAVGPVEIGPGYAAAVVTGKHSRIYQSDVGVRTLADSEWEQVAEAIASRAAHAAALLDGELAPELIEDALAVDVRLLPGPGDLRADCSCPDYAEPCKHTAAVCYLVAAEIDRDPFQLLLLRGIRRDDLLAMVRARRTGRPDELQTVTAGLDAAAAYAARPLESDLDPVPDVVASVPVPREPARSWIDVDDQATAALDQPLSRVALEGLADDAIERAWLLSASGTPSGLDSSSKADMARRAATGTPRLREVLAAAVGLPLARLEAWSDAWDIAGDVGVDIIVDDSLWISDPARLEAAREDLVDLGLRRQSVGLGWNALHMADHVRLVIGPDERWYRLQDRGRRREVHLTAPPAGEVTGLVALPLA